LMPPLQASATSHSFVAGRHTLSFPCRLSMQLRLIPSHTSVMSQSPPESRQMVPPSGMPHVSEQQHSSSYSHASPEQRLKVPDVEPAVTVRIRKTLFVKRPET